MDKDTVMSWLEGLTEDDWRMFHSDSEVSETAKAALALIKEQEAVVPITQSSVYDPDTWFYVCGSCKKGIVERGDKYCRWCGQAVMWE